jgi:hypothetical protein
MRGSLKRVPLSWVEQNIQQINSNNSRPEPKPEIKEQSGTVKLVI